MIEIERKFLLGQSHLKTINLSQLDRVAIKQGYLGFDPVVRVRISRQGNFFGVKGPGAISRLELEYQIPLEDAEKLIEMSPGKIVKTRYFYPGKNDHLWEIDVFDGKLAGLIIAEVELKSEDEKYEKPAWMAHAAEVSENRLYTNAELSKATDVSLYMIF